MNGRMDGRRVIEVKMRLSLNRVVSKVPYKAEIKAEIKVFRTKCAIKIDRKAKVGRIGIE